MAACQPRQDRRRRTTSHRRLILLCHFWAYIGDDFGASRRRLPRHFCDSLAAAINIMLDIIHNAFDFRLHYFYAYWSRIIRPTGSSSYLASRRPTLYIAAHANFTSPR